MADPSHLGGRASSYRVKRSAGVGEERPLGARSSLARTRLCLRAMMAPSSVGGRDDSSRRSLASVPVGLGSAGVLR